MAIRSHALFYLNVESRKDPPEYVSRHELNQYGSKRKVFLKNKIVKFYEKIICENADM